MNKLLQLSAIALFLVACPNVTNAQYVTPCPLNMAGMNAYPAFLHVPKANVVWIAMQGFNGASLINSSSYAYSMDGGQTFITGSVPDMLNRGGSDVFALNVDTAWIALTDGYGVNGGAIWRTNNGGNLWIQQTTTEFAGGFLDIVNFSNANNGTAIGDPNSGYFEIYNTTDGGNSWLRVPQGNIPSPLLGEYALQNSSVRINSRFWFSTSKGRIFYSTDDGYTWNVSVVNATFGYTHITMNDENNGLAWMANNSAPYITTDGGVTWTIKQTSPPVFIDMVSAIKNDVGAFVFKTVDGIFATTDNFNSFYLIDNQQIVDGNTLKMFDATVGYTQRADYQSDSVILKIVNGVSAKNNLEESNSLFIYPNPSNGSVVNISFNSEIRQEFLLKITDMTGRIIYHKNSYGENGSNRIKVTLPALTNGIYIVELAGRNNKLNQRLIIQQ